MHSFTKIFTSLFCFSLSLARAAAPPQYPCDSVTGGGYLGNVGTSSGNCTTNTLPPLDAFGSLTINQNAPLGASNRLNPQQLPFTNSFQNFQNICSIYQTDWESTTPNTNNISIGGGDRKMRSGFFLVGITRTGPCMTVPIYNFNKAGSFGSNPQGFPQLVIDSRNTIFFSAAECTQSFFNVSTDVQNSETCVITYTPRDGSIHGLMKDYNITGNIFHDVYYENLTPVIGTSVNLYNDRGYPVIVDQGPVRFYQPGERMTGNSFQFFVNRYNYPAPPAATIIFPATFILFAEGANGAPVNITLAPQPELNLPFSFEGTFTGFLRLAAISSNNPAPIHGQTNWPQTTYFMPENLADSADTSNPPSSCPIETPNSPGPACPLNVSSPSWYTTGSVTGIAPTGLNFYMLYPCNVTAQYPNSYAWAQLFSQLAFRIIGPNWASPTTPAFTPAVVPLSNFLPVIALSGYPGSYATSYDLANAWYNQMLGSPPIGLPGGPPDVATNAFLLQFDMCFAFNNRADVSTYQLTRALPTYTVTPPNNAQIYANYSRFIPTKASISTTDTTVTWTYTLSDIVTPPGGQKKVLTCFPFWKYLAAGQTLENYIYNDTIKGTCYAVGANAGTGAVTFTETALPSWYGQPGSNPAAPDVYFPTTGPSALVFTPTQITALDAGWTAITTLLTPSLPYFNESNIDDPYNAGKICYMLAKTALYGAYYFKQKGATDPTIIANTKPFIEMAKSVLTAYLVGRTPGSDFFIADQVAGGICVNGAGGFGDWPNGPDLQQINSSGKEFGNYIYNDHHFFAGYYINAAAMITNWELLYPAGQVGGLWANLNLIGGDTHTPFPANYKMREFVDFLWRDTHNPFTNDTTQPVYDLDMPYDRYGFPWEGHGIANGISNLSYAPNPVGRNQESIAEDFNCWVATNAFARLMIAAGFSSTKYTTLQAFTDFNLKISATGAIQWLKNDKYWLGYVTSTGSGRSGNMSEANPSFLGPSIHLGQYSQATVTTGQVDDTDALNQTFF